MLLIARSGQGRATDTTATLLSSCSSLTTFIGSTTTLIARESLHFGMFDIGFTVKSCDSFPPRLCW